MAALPGQGNTSPNENAVQTSGDKGKLNADDRKFCDSENQDDYLKWDRSRPAMERQGGGYELSLFADKEEANEYICALCQLVLKKPTFIGCKKKHSYCKLCIVDLINSVKHRGSRSDFYHSESFPVHENLSKQVKCPKCDEKIDIDKRTDELDEDRYADIMILEVSCGHCNTWTGTLSAYEKKHLKKQCTALHKVLPNTMQIFVKTLEDRTIAFNNVTGKETIAWLQQSIEDKEGIPIAQQWLFYAGKPVNQIYKNGMQQREAVINDYGIHDQSTLNLMKRMKGGN